jgi:hypothetical protein
MESFKPRSDRSLTVRVEIEFPENVKPASNKSRLFLFIEECYWLFMKGLSVLTSFVSICRILVLLIEALHSFFPEKLIILLLRCTNYGFNKG